MKSCVKYRFLRKNIAARSRFEVNFKPSCPYPTKINSVDIPHFRLEDYKTTKPLVFQCRPNTNKDIQ